MENWKDPSTPLTWLMIALGLFILIMGFFLWLTRLYIQRIKREAQVKKDLMERHQRNLLENTVESEEKEKKRIATKLHDDILGQLHHIKLLNEDEAINTLLSTSINHIRDISHELTPPFIEMNSMDTIIRNLLQPLSKSYQISFFFTEYDDLEIQPSIKLQIYRILQELIVNMIKHANASELDVQWRIGSNYCALTVKDNGIGIKPGESQGLGLKSIESRAALLNARCRFKSNSGTQFIILIPLKRHG